MTMCTAAIPREPASPPRDDVATAAHIQRMLLPPSPLTANGWTAVHHFEPAGSISGDFVDLVPFRDRLYFMLGDASGKGAAASLVMAQLHAMFRTLIPFQLSLDDLMARASGLLCANSLPAQYATLVSGYLTTGGDLVIANAGHPPPLTISGTRHTDVRATGVPMGMFCESQFSARRLTFAPGDTLLVYSDGLTEAEDARGQPFEEAGLEAVVRTYASDSPESLAAAAFRNVEQHTKDSRITDDLTILLVKRTDRTPG